MLSKVLTVQPPLPKRGILLSLSTTATEVPFPDYLDFTTPIFLLDIKSLTYVRMIPQIARWICEFPIFFSTGGVCQTAPTTVAIVAKNYSSYNPTKQSNTLT